MSKFLNHTEKIEAYLEGSMSPDEMLEFENQLPTDPVMRSEFELQQDVIHSLKDFRKSQLKARLDQVPISMGPSTLIGVKTAAVIVLTGFMGVATYLYFNSGNEATTTFESEPIAENQLEITTNEEVAATEDLTVEEQPQDEINTEEISKTAQSEETSPAESAVIKPVEQESSSVTIDETNDPIATISDRNTPVVNVPQVDLPETDSQATVPEESVEMPSSAIAQEEPFDDAVVEIETAKKDRQLFHYQYYSGKLYLYGDFKDMPYEILELNSKSGKKLFMYYNNEYFEILNDRVELTPLIKLQNSEIIDKLEIIKENK